MGPQLSKRIKLVGMVSLACAAMLAVFACQNTGTQGPALFNASGSSREKWTIRCTRIESPNHAQQANSLAEPLKQVRGLNPSKVHVVSAAGSSTIYYGEYEKVKSADGSLVFPPEFQRDVELIRSLSYQSQTPFFFAAPELIASGDAVVATGAPGDIATAKGTYSLEIALFYNEAGYDQHRSDSETYVKDLRSRGYDAYYYHEALRSFVFVGDFDASDMTKAQDGSLAYGPRVSALIARNPDEFQFLTENGMKIKHRMANNQVIPNPSILLPMPGKVLPARPAPPRGDGGMRGR